ncbi:competence regulator inhibitor paratox [Streptococcus cameli]
MDLNDLYRAVVTGEIDRSNVRIVRKNGKIVDYLLPEETISENEEVEIMKLEDLLAEMFGYQYSIK